MITVKYVSTVGLFRKRLIFKVFVDITLSTFNFANMSSGLSGVHWQQTGHGWVTSASIPYIVCATGQCHVSSCQIRNIVARHVSKVKGRYGNIDENSNFAYFGMIKQLKHILQ